MKKFLSLVLALVMTMSLVTVSAGAKDFTDSDKITYTEAVDVMSAIGVIDGYTTGDFKPTATLTRGAAAKIICNLILGPTTASALATTTAPFSDVPADSTFAGYIAYCAKEGIVGGYADGTFKPGNSLTGYAFLKMLLGALGYDADIEGYSGANYAVSVAKQAIEAGLTKGLVSAFDGTKAVTREQACQYAFNTLKAIMVEYDNRIVVGEGSTAVAISGVRKDLSWNKGTKNDGNIEADGFVQFAEQYFPNLSVETSNGKYGRPANTWKLKKSEIGTYTSIEPAVTYTEEVKEKEIYNALGKVVCSNEYDWEIYVDGVKVADRDVKIPAKIDDKYTYTKNGAVTEIYVDDTDEHETVTVVMINYYMGEVSKVKTDDDGEYITVKSLKSGVSVDNKTFYVEGYKEDDYVVFTKDYDNDEKESVIGEVCEPEVVTGEVTRVESDKDTGATYLRVEGGKYTYSYYIVYDLDNMNEKAHPALNDEYNLYLDPNGYVVAFEKTEEEASKYLYVKDADEHLGTWEAKVVLADGSTVKVELKDELKKTPADFGDKIKWNDDADKQHTVSSANVTDRIWKYTVNDKGVYTLTYVENYTLTNGEIKNGKAYISEGDNDYIVDSETAFVDVDNETAYEGYKNVPNVSNADGKYVKDGKIVDALFILDGNIYDKDSTYFFLTKTTRESLKYDGDYYWEYSKSYVNGDKKNVIVAYDALVDGEEGQTLNAGVLYKAKKTVDEVYITEVEVVGNIEKTVSEVGVDAFWLTVTQSKEVKYDVDDDTIFVLVEKDKDGKYTVSEGNIKDLKAQEGYTTTALVVESDEETAELVYILVVEGEAEEKPETTKYTVTVNEGTLNGSSTPNTLFGQDWGTEHTKSVEVAKNGTATITFTRDSDKLEGVAGTGFSCTPSNAKVNYNEATGVLTITVTNVTANTTVSVDYAG